MSTRRKFLAGLSGTALAFPAATALLAYPAEDEIIEETAIKRIWRRYFTALREHHAMLERVPVGQWTAASALSPMRKTMHEAQRAMSVEPITSLEDLGLKAWTLVNIPGDQWELREECMAFMDGAV